MLNNLENCTLAFISAEDESDIDSAINTTTSSTGYSHVGLIHKNDYDSFNILHSSPKTGVISEPLEWYLKNLSSNQYIDIYEFINLSNEDKNDAIKMGLSFIGKPYNHSFYSQDDGFYCSELIYEIFKKHDIFESIPMNFDNPDTGEVHKYWEEYFLKLNKKVPHQEQGSNPNDMSFSPHINKIETVYLANNKNEILKAYDIIFKKKIKLR